MSAHKPQPDDEKLTSMLLGQLSPEEADRLATEMLDNSQVTPAAEKLPDDTLIAGVKQATTAVDAEADQLANRLVERLKSESVETTAAYPEADEAAEAVPADLEYFRVEKEIGRGGMGMVYLARDTRLNRPVAIKTLRADLAKKASAKERFLREARVAAALEHESIVPIYYVGEGNGIPFLAMPVLKGQGLDDHLKGHGGRLPPAEVIRIASQIAGGLAAAHAVGLIHRDIKPSNVWVDADGRRVRVLDFGLARYETDESNLTVSGMIVGTPAYMAPEQARGRGVDARADLFSLGVVMYQMLTGRRPFTGTDAVSIISSLALDTPAAPNVVNFDVPSELSDLVMRLLEKEPSNRPASAAVVRQALDRLATQPTEDRTELDFSPPTPAGRQTKTQPKAARKVSLLPLAVAAGLFLLVAGGAAAVYQFVFSTKDGTLVVEVDESADVRFKNGKLEVYDEKGALKYTIEPSEKNKALPPGKYTVKVVGADGVKLDTDKFEIEKNGKVLVKVTSTGPEVAKKSDPVKPDPLKSTSPDVVKSAAPGTPLALKPGTWKPGPSDNILPGLVSRPAILDGVGRWQVVTTTTPAWVTAFSPDGQWVATADADYVRIYKASSGELSAVGKRTTTATIHQTNPTLGWSPDSKWVRVFESRGLVVTNCDLLAADGSRSTVPWIASNHPDLGWSPKHPEFACRSTGVATKVAIFDPTKEKPIEVEVGDIASGVWTPDGDKILLVLADTTGVLVGRDGKIGAKFAAGFVCNMPDGTQIQPQWTPDGSMLAAPMADGVVGLWKADGTLAAKTGKHEKQVLALHWKPDGKLLAVTEAEGKRHFWKPDATREGSVDTKDGTPGFVWAKDGKGFFTPGKFWPAVGNPSFTSLTNALDMMAVVSPDQTSVALAKRGEIVISEWKGGEAKDTGMKIRQTADGVPWWSVDGKRFVVADVDGIAVYDARDAKKVLRLGGGAGVGLLSRGVFSPKGDRLAVANNYGTIVILEPTGKVLRSLTTPKAPADTPTFVPSAIYDMQWHPDGKHLVVVSGVTAVTVFDTESGKVEAAAKVEGSRPTGSAIFSPSNPDHLLIAHPDAAALWRWKVEKDPLQKFPGLGKLVPSPDGKWVLALQAGAAWHGNDFFSAAILTPDLKDRDTAGTKEYIANGNHPGPSLAWHPDGKQLVVTRLGEARSIQIRSLDGKVVDEIKPDGIDLTWVEWVGPAVGNVLVGRVQQWSETYVFDLSTKKVTPFGRVSGELMLSPDGKHLIAMEGSTLTYWNLATKAVVQRVVLLPNGEFVTLSVAGEVLEKSANADNFYRYVIEDRTGKLTVRTRAEMVPSLPKTTGMAPLDPEWLKEVAAMPAEKQGVEVSAELKRRNPMYNGEYKCDHSSGKVESFEFDSSAVTDMRPLTALPHLKRLSVRDNTSHGERRLPPLDITPLAGLPLVRLDLTGTQVTDLSPLKGMPLEVLHAHYTQVKDLTPLKGMPLTELGIGATGVTDLTPLVGMKLKRLGAHPYTPVTDLSPLAGMPLELLYVGRIQDAAPLKGMPIKDLVAGLRLYSEADEKVYRSLPLERWNDKPAADVWKEVEAARKADADAVERLKKVPVEKAALEKALREECLASVANVTVSDGAVVGIYFEAGAPNQVGKLRAFPKLKRLTVVPNSDLSALVGLPVEEIDCTPADLGYNSPILKAIPTLKTINGQSAKEVLDGRGGAAGPDAEWARGVANLPADEQVKAVVAELKKRNPHYEGKHTHRVEGGVVVRFAVNGYLQDITPLRALAGLKDLEVYHRPEEQGAYAQIPLNDLSPLRGLKLTRFHLLRTKVTDLSPLREMLLDQVNIYDAPVADLSPLRGMPLGWVGLTGTGVSDLSPLKGATISFLDISETGVSDLTPLHGQPLVNVNGTGKMKDLSPFSTFPKLRQLLWVGPEVSDVSGLRGLPIQVLDLRGTKVSDLSPLRGMPLESLSLDGANVTDLTPIKDCPLKHLQCDYKPERDRGLLAGINTLETLNAKPAKEVLK